VEIGVIRHAYGNVLNACARLFSFATGRPPTTDGRLMNNRKFWRLTTYLGSLLTHDDFLKIHILSNSLRKSQYEIRQYFNL
jgi:hypothetical protein